MGKLFFGAGILGIAAWLIALAAWVTHFVDTINDGEWILFIAGLLIPPIGVLHGIGLWLGIFV